MSAGVVEGFDLAAVAHAGGAVTGAVVTPRRTGVLRVSVAFDVDGTMTVQRNGGAAANILDGTAFGANNAKSFVLTVVKDSTYQFSFTGNGNVIFFSADIVYGEVI